MSFAEITLTNTANYSLFSIFYQAAFLIPFVILISIGIKRKYKMVSWYAIMLSSALFFLLGTRLTTFNQTEWTNLYSQGIWPVSYHKFALGGIIFALAGVELTRRFLKFDKPVLQIYAWLTPIALAIQKVGCLFSGCCYGNATTLPWGIKYATGTIPYYDQLSSGLINTDAPTSLSIHPTQIYQLLAYLTISIIVLSVRRKLKRSESIIVLSLFLLFLSRLLIEFYIDTNATNFGAGIILGLKQIQWICLILSLLSIALLILYEKGLIRAWKLTKGRNQTLRATIVIICVGIIFVMAHNAFTSKELVAFNIRFIIISVLFAFALYRKFSIRKLRWLSPLILLLPLLLISQTEPKSKKDFEKSNWLSFGSTVGHYYNEVLYNPTEGSCGTSYVEIPYDNKVFTLGGQYSSEGRSGFQSYKIGSDIIFGSVNERNMYEDASIRRPIALVNPYAEYNWRWLGVGANLNLGYVPMVRMNPSDSNRPPDNNHFITPIMPGFMARIGPYDILDLQLDFNNSFPSPLPISLLELSIGSGFGFKNGSGLRFGTIPNYGESLFLEGDLIIKNKYGINFRYTHWTQRFYPEDNEKSNIFSVGFSYNLK